MVLVPEYTANVSSGSPQRGYAHKHNAPNVRTRKTCRCLIDIQCACTLHESAFVPFAHKPTRRIEYSIEIFLLFYLSLFTINNLGKH